MAYGRFLPGLVLAERFYREAVEPLVRAHFGEVPHSAARIGAGSEVLGFDTERSVDHEWGPRLQLFLGFPTHFAPTEDEGVGRMEPTDGPGRHRVEVTDAGTWFERRLGFDPRGGVTVRDWLGAPTQRWAETTAGAVFHDGSPRWRPGCTSKAGTGSSGDAVVPHPASGHGTTARWLTD